MNAEKDSKIGVAAYLDNLLIQLRLLDVPGERIGQILAEVETHVADTGLDPVDAFGDPGEYAAACVAAANSPIAQGASRSWSRDIGGAVVGGLSGVAGSIGAINLTGSVDVTARFLGMSLAAGAVGLVVKSVVWPALKRDTARSFTPRRFTSRFMGLGLLAWLGGVAVLVPIALLPTGPTLIALPGWMLLVAGALTLFNVVRNLGGDRVVDPRG